MTRLLHCDVRRLAAGRNDFTAYAFNRGDIRSDIASAHDSGRLFPSATAYVLAIGIDQYTDPALRSLRFAATDAEAFAAAIGPEMHFIRSLWSHEIRMRPAKTYCAVPASILLRDRMGASRPPRD